VSSGSTLRRRLLVCLAAALAAFCLTGLAATGSEGDPPSGAAAAAEHETGHEVSHEDPFTYILLELAGILGLAVLGRWLAGRTGQPAVLGELLIGVAAGNLLYWLGEPVGIVVMHMHEFGTLIDEVWRTGQPVAEVAQRILAPEAAAELTAIMTGPQGPRLIDMGVALWIFSSLGVILLLFMVGLESSVAEMQQVGTRATAVAVMGVVAPFLLAVGVTAWLMPDQAMPAHLFVAATLCATSVGITARVFRDLGRLHSSEAKLILGAAVIDDVLGLIILAVVVGIVSTGEVELGHVARITVLAGIFLGVVLVFGERVLRWAVPLFESLDRNHGKLLFPLFVCFVLSWIANQIELAPIVGAFAAGLILTEEHFSQGTVAQTMEELLRPLEAIFAPVFFVLMGMQVNLASFADPATALLALAFSVAAILGKLVSGYVAGAGSDRLSIGIGMVPRGEVGLIFASIGKGLGVVDDTIFSAIVVMVMVTTLLTPVGLRWSLFRQRAPAADA
jgi:Kef-type K+ transport system membrane component KefB